MNKVQKRILGKDESNTYDILCYTFEPMEYQKVAIFTFIAHGVEEQTSLAAYQLFEHMVNYDDVCQNSPVLDYMRKKVKLIVIPILNPYGLQNRTYGNVNQVNSSRNFPYYWKEYESTESEYDKKGSAPFSEAETVILRDICIENLGNVDFIIDCHTGDGW